jgi:hypothetical protein
VSRGGSDPFYHAFSIGLTGALGRLYATLGRPEASSKAYRSAVDVVDRIKASVDDPKLAETIASAPPVREVKRYLASSPWQK